MINTTSFLATVGCDFNGTHPDYEEGALEFWFRLFSLYLPIGLLAIGIMGNVLIMLTVHKSKFRNSVVVFHFKVLAFVDLLSSLDMVHGIFIQNTPHLIYDWGDLFCKEHQFISFTCFEVSAWCVVTLTVDRFIAIRFPLKKSAWSTWRRAKIIFLSNVFVHMLINIPRVVFMEFRCPKGDDVIYYEICDITSNVPTSFRQYLELSHLAFDVALPCGIVVVVNTMILLKLRKQRKHFNDLGCSQHTHSNGGVTRMLLAMSFAFVFFMSAWPVDYVYWVILYPDQARDQPDIRRLMFAVTYVFVTCNNQFNFYIYLSSSSSFRQDFKRLLKKLLRKDEGDSNSTNLNGFSGEVVKLSSRRSPTKSY
jgi:heme/copper-type cytochrome/quinol oxidase subunit 2